MFSACGPYSVIATYAATIRHLVFPAKKEFFKHLFLIHSPFFNGNVKNLSARCCTTSIDRFRVTNFFHESCVQGRPITVQWYMLSALGGTKTIAQYFTLGHCISTTNGRFCAACIVSASWVHTLSMGTVSINWDTIYDRTCMKIDGRYT